MEIGDQGIHTLEFIARINENLGVTGIGLNLTTGRSGFQASDRGGTLSRSLGSPGDKTGRRKILGRGRIGGEALLTPLC